MTKSPTPVKAAQDKLAMRSPRGVAAKFPSSSPASSPFKSMRPARRKIRPASGDGCNASGSLLQAPEELQVSPLEAAKTGYTDEALADVNVDTSSPQFGDSSALLKDSDESQSKQVPKDRLGSASQKQAPAKAQESDDWDSFLKTRTKASRSQGRVRGAAGQGTTEARRRTSEHAHASRQQPPPLPPHPDDDAYRSAEEDTCERGPECDAGCKCVSFIATRAKSSRAQGRARGTIGQGAAEARRRMSEQAQASKAIPPPPPPHPEDDAYITASYSSGEEDTGDLATDSGGCKTCTCKKSKCLKLYCECFAAKQFCSGCSCIDCLNREETKEKVLEARQRIQARSPMAFAPKALVQSSGEAATHRKGCKCKRSHCQKNYCECFQAGLRCSDMCKCVGCKNCGPPEDQPSVPPSSKMDAAPPAASKAGAQSSGAEVPLSASPATVQGKTSARGGLVTPTAPAASRPRSSKGSRTSASKPAETGGPEKKPNTQARSSSGRHRDSKLGAMADLEKAITKAQQRGIDSAKIVEQLQASSKQAAAASYSQDAAEPSEPEAPHTVSLQKENSYANTGSSSQHSRPSAGATARGGGRDSSGRTDTRPGSDPSATGHHSADAGASRGPSRRPGGARAEWPGGGGRLGGPSRAARTLDYNQEHPAPSSLAPGASSAFTPPRQSRPVEDAYDTSFTPGTTPLGPDDDEHSLGPLHREMSRTGCEPSQYRAGPSPESSPEHDGRYQERVVPVKGFITGKMLSEGRYQITTDHGVPRLVRLVEVNGAYANGGPDPPRAGRAQGRASPSAPIVGASSPARAGDQFAPHASAQQGAQAEQHRRIVDNGRVRRVRTVEQDLLTEEDLQEEKDPQHVYSTPPRPSRPPHHSPLPSSHMFSSPARDSFASPAKGFFSSPLSKSDFHSSLSNPLASSSHPQALHSPLPTSFVAQGLGASPIAHVHSQLDPFTSSPIKGTTLAALQSSPGFPHSLAASFSSPQKWVPQLPPSAMTTPPPPARFSRQSFGPMKPTSVAKALYSPIGSPFPGSSPLRLGPGGGGAKRSSSDFLPADSTMMSITSIPSLEHVYSGGVDPASPPRTSARDAEPARKGVRRALDAYPSLADMAGTREHTEKVGAAVVDAACASPPRPAMVPVVARESPTRLTPKRVRSYCVYPPGSDGGARGAGFEGRDSPSKLIASPQKKSRTGVALVDTPSNSAGPITPDHNGPRLAEHAPYTTAWA